MVDSVSYTTKSCKMVFPISFLVYSVNYHVCLLITTTVVSEDNYSRQGFMAINNPACGLGIGWFVDHCLPWFKYNTRHFVLPFSFNEGSGRLSNSTTPPSLLPPPSSLLPSPLPALSSPPNCEHTYSGTEDGPAHVRQHAKQNHQGPTTPQSILEENNPQAPNMYSLYEEGYRQSRGRGEKRGKRERRGGTG